MDVRRCYHRNHYHHRKPISRERSGVCLRRTGNNRAGKSLSVELYQSINQSINQLINQ